MIERDDNEARVTQSVFIRKPRADVFAFLTDFANHAKFSEIFIQTRQSSDGPFDTGTTAIRVARFFGREFEFRQLVTEYIPGREFTILNLSAVFETRENFRVEDYEEGTRLTVTVITDVKFFSRLVLLPLLPQADRQVQRDLQTLRELLEAQP